MSASKATFVRAIWTMRTDARVYDVEFYSGSKESDYEIDAPAAIS